ncbi:MAG: DUF3574 domain-containing protein [Phreatobacter sp.]|uniref:DUF3574 domain-containing protein n=1 Tax=Phreatobacter sp. TaxID=1966341 RepID=UPI001A616B34|nr:DUF3574 domain-containing protein [Phreatobacter sp.]MBL8568886.1 DUF3574 domain-containing protein [Phreatobacter sp.]
MSREQALLARAALVLAALALAGCATVGAPPCPPGGRDRVVADLMFGRNIGGALGVSERSFARFVDAEVTPRFPDGLTILDTRGQYRSANGALIREPGKVITIVLADEARDLPRLAEVAEAYKRRFRQESVGVITRRACVAF